VITLIWAETRILLPKIAEKDTGSTLATFRSNSGKNHILLKIELIFLNLLLEKESI